MMPLERKIIKGHAKKKDRGEVNASNYSATYRTKKLP